MTDHVSPSRRSEIMRNIKSKNTSPELFVRSLLHRMGYRFRLHIRNLPGCPDIVLPRRRKIIFVHGCFWHSHKNCKKASLPKSNVPFWMDKLLRNKARDIADRQSLKRLGWQVLTIWQCDLKLPEKLEGKLRVFLEK
jgi:DNA mismatch endonuclease (patch repair protein)